MQEKYGKAAGCKSVQGKQIKIERKEGSAYTVAGAERDADTRDTTTRRATTTDEPLPPIRQLHGRGNDDKKKTGDITQFYVEEMDEEDMTRRPQRG